MTERKCDFCKVKRTNPDGTSAVQRWGISRQIVRKAEDGRTFNERVYGGSLELCDRCVEEFAAPRKRPRTSKP